MNRQKRKNRKKLSKKKDDTEDTPTEVLSQEEIDQLLTAINGDEEEGDNKPSIVSYHTISNEEIRHFEKEIESLRQDYTKFKEYLQKIAQ